ncbi:MAG: hypothetical protein RBR45_12065 [Pseudomonas sp.]|nr:hypothetical protein [Pseudomonas sp.]
MKIHKYIRKRRIANMQTTLMINECRISAVTSVAMDGAAPELRPDGALREEQH